ncbi:MAG: phosphatidylserine decarboxylase [Thermodesulfobacteriota bacterium]
MQRTPHQFIDRRTGRAVTESLYADRTVNFLYNEVRERSATAFRALTSARACAMLGWLRYDLVLGRRRGGPELLRGLGVDPAELVDDPATLDTARKVFERKIRYWDCRPLDPDPAAVVSPADSRVIVGSLRDASALFVKNKFFDLAELLGGPQSRWARAFRHGDYAVFRLTPDKYHYNHAPVSGRVVDYYELDGGYHSCNPGALLCLPTPYSKNRRAVTVIDTDLPQGSGAGLVAMVEVVALMIGEVAQCYCETAYDDPRPVRPGLWIKRGQPKSLFRPGSSTVLLLFQEGRVEFCDDILANLHASGVSTRFGQGLGRPLVETEVEVRSRIASVRGPAHGRVGRPN